MYESGLSVCLAVWLTGWLAQVAAVRELVVADIQLAEAAVKVWVLGVQHTWQKQQTRRAG